MLIRTSVIAITSLLLSGCIINVNGADMGPLEHEYRELSLDASALQQLIAQTGAGKLNIVGAEALQQIKVQADIYYHQDQSPDLDLYTKGKQAILKAEFNNSVSFGRSPYIDLTIQVPAELALDIDDGSGAINIAKVNANIQIEDGSGAINIVGGHNLAIDDGSGSISVSQVQGNITLDDGSGAIDINQVQGNVNIKDGSGSLSVRQVLGKVTIDDGSGDIEVEHAQGLTIVDAGSGDVRFDNINGPVSMH